MMVTHSCCGCKQLVEEVEETYEESYFFVRVHLPSGGPVTASISSIAKYLGVSVSTVSTGTDM
jgi:hypothetical protein